MSALVLGILAVLAAAEWLTRPATGRHHAPPRAHLPHRHHHQAEHAAPRPDRAVPHGRHEIGAAA